MKLRTKILIILVVLMLIPTIALAKEVTDGTNYSIDVPDTYTEVADNQFRKDNGENFSVFTSEPLENTNLTEEEFKVITDYVVDQVKSEGTYTINHLGNEIVTVTKNNYKAYLAKFEMSAGSIKMILRQYYFVTPEKSVLFTETRFNESDYETAEAKGILEQTNGDMLDAIIILERRLMRSTFFLNLPVNDMEIRATINDVKVKENRL